MFQKVLVSSFLDLLSNSLEQYTAIVYHLKLFLDKSVSEVHDCAREIHHGGASALISLSPAFLS